MGQNIKVAYRQTSLGMIIMPVSNKINEKIANYLAEFGEEWNGIYLQEWNAEEIVETFTSSQRRDFENGWNVVRIEPLYDFLCGVGYDAYTLA